ncbi:MAG: hypothetical protein HYT79_09040 [Elusimicrobia bacterium]|nr:hypothetical protein [Elusimicrobiota bacterium]
MIRRLITVAQLTTLEEVRSKVLNATFLFAGVLVYFGLVITTLAQGFEARFFRDVAFTMIELFGLAIIFQSVYRVVRQDVRKGSAVEMFFVRPLSRWEYLVGRLIGVSILLWVGLAVMAGVQLGLTAAKGFGFHWFYVIAYLEVYLKLMVVIAVTAVLAVVTTSQASYFVSGLLVYASGHVMHLLRALLEAKPGSDFVSMLLIKPLTYLLPNFSLYATVNNLDALIGRGVAFAWGDVGLAVCYTVFYAGALTAISAFLFSKTEISPG